MSTPSHDPVLTSDRRRSCSRQNRRAFTLIEILIVVAIIAGLAALAVLQMGRARITADEQSALNSLRLLAKSSQFFFMTRQGYPASLSDLGRPTSNPPYVEDTSLSTGSKHGYQFVYTPGPESPPDSFTLLANPTSHAVTGERHFFVTQEMTIHATTQNRDATAGDPVVP